MILLPDDKAQGSSYVFARGEGQIAQAAGDLAAEYNAQTPAQRADLVDMHIAAQWSARVYRDHVGFMCDPTNSVIQDVPLAGRVPASLVYPEGYDRASGSVDLVLDSGAMVELGCSAKKAFVRASSRSLDQKYKRVYKSGSETVGLRADGRLFKLNGTSSTPLQTSADGQIHELVPNENYSFFDAADASL
jgi:hypothetical protein